MEEVRQLVQEEGREARNLVAFHVAVDTPATPARVSRKPPRSSGVSMGLAAGQLGGQFGGQLGSAARRGAPRTSRRSASAGRDKRSELRARYWALLFGDLSRAMGEIYNTVEAHENLNECQEVILVLENYTRDFKALGEWFRLKWEYDNTPPPQRPQSLAWEIRKTDFVRPESRRTYSVKSSPSVSGKNSPCLSGHNTPSGKNSPSLTGKASPGSGKISPRVSSGHSSTSPKANIEFFSSKIAASKVTAKPEPNIVKDCLRLSDIKEKDGTILDENNAAKAPSVDQTDDKPEPRLSPIIELGKAKECPNICPKQVIIKSPKHALNISQNNRTDVETTSSASDIITKLNAMETQFLQNHLAENEAKNDNLLNIENEISALCINENSDGKKMDPQSVQVNQDFDNGSDKITTSDEKETSSNASPTKSEDNFADVSNESSSKSNDEKPPNVVEAAKLSKIDETNLSKIDKGEKSEVVMEEVVKERPISGQNDEITDATGTVGNTECNEDVKLKGIENNTVFESKDDSKNEQDKKSELKISNETKSNTRPAYSQAAAKPKPVNIKSEVKTPTKTTPLTRSKTVVEMRSSSAPKTSRQFPKRNQANKCSYPFNLTTGRTSLFDTVPSNTTKSTVPKKTIRNVQLGSGDSKLNSNKVDIKKQPPRPTSLKINEKGDKKENINITLEKIKDCDAYGSSDTIVTQIDISRIESSESLKTLVPEELQMIQDVANSIEVLNVDDNNKSDNEGWLTVKSRRLSRESKKQSKSHWANRFHQPSATTSLPTLNMLESPKQETKSIVDSPKNAKLDRAKSEQPSSIDTKPEKVVKVQDTEKVSTESKSKDTAIIRQKSDVTGLKTRSSRNKAFTKRTAKIQDEDKDEESIELTKNRLHSSLESLTMGLARSQESTEEAFDFDKWKAEFKSTFTFLDDDDQIPNHNELLKAADPSEMSEIAEMTSQIEENEKKISWALDFQSEVDQRKLCEEEEILNRQIMALQQVSDIDMDTETDDTETDAEILCEETSIAHPACASSENLGALAASLEDQYETALAGMSWAERVDTLVVLEALVARDPGRAQQLHEKLSQGLKRRGSFQDALRRLQAKQARAERQRLEYQTERARKIHQLLARVEEVKIAKNQLIEEKRLRMERRMQKATENRDQRLKDIVRKAHDEEEKLREIAFIKQLEAENRRHEFLEQCRSHTTRLRTMRRDRLLKLEQKAAREAAVGARRQALEAARLLHVQSLVERRQERDARRHQLRELRRLQRGHAAREKAEGVKSRLSALAAAAELEADALRCRIRHKQRASQQRLQSHLQAIREKATGPRQPTTSESQDPNTKEERELQEEAERLELERKEREKQKAIKRKARKVKQKLLSTGNEMSVFDENIIFEFATFPSSNKLHKVIHTITNMITPLLQTEDKEDKRDHQNEADDLEKNNKRNKKADKNKLAAINGNEENTEKKKSKKKKNVEEQPKTDNAEYNNNTEAEIIEDQDVKNENSKKKKKRSDKSDRPKLSKTSSVCSSLSDMSKTSGKSEKKTQPTIDMPFLERQLNELQRIIDRFDRMSADKSGPARLQALRAAARVLALAAQQDAQLSCRSITAAVSVAARISACGGAASCLIAGDTAVHLVTLLSDQLDKDLSADLREMELTKQLADCLSVALDSVLCATRLYEEKRTEPGDDLEIITTLRSRAHAIISYLCLCGCISRAEKAGEARESVQTLLTVCADLCHPCDLDVGSERASATQSLRCALGTSVCGSRAEFCVLFAKGAELSQSGGFVRAARTAHLLRALAELDHQIVQEAFGEGGWPLEFRAAVARLLSQHAPNDKEAPRTAALRLCNQRLDQTLSETMVLDLIVLVGFVVVNNPQLQETICDGWSVIKTLCTLPANWLVSKVHSHALLPTLIAVSERPSAASAIASELSMKMLEDYLESPDAQKVKLVQVIKQGRAKKSGKK